MIYTNKMRERISNDAKGKIIESLEWCEYEEDKYWAMIFTDGSEICFRFMAEMVNES